MPADGRKAGKQDTEPVLFKASKNYQIILCIGGDVMW
jgi:hypothetical protein